MFNKVRWRAKEAFCLIDSTYASARISRFVFLYKMERARRLLFYTRDIPYISKKDLNDRLTAVALRSLPLRFFKSIYRTTEKVLAPAVSQIIVKGGAAFIALLNETIDDNINNVRLSDLDLEILINKSGDDNNDNNDDNNVCDEQSVIDCDFVKSRLPVAELQRALETIAADYYESVNGALSDIRVEDLIAVNNSSFNNLQSTIVFCSYVDEAIEFLPHTMRFHLNPKNPFKLTISSVDDNYVLVRFSFNVHMRSGMPIFLHGNNGAGRLLDYFPLDLYFLDMSVKENVLDDKIVWWQKSMFDTTILIDTPHRIIADQLESMMFNIFYMQRDKVSMRLDRIVSLLFLYDCQPTHDQQSLYRELKRNIELNKSPSCRVKDVKRFMYVLGPRLGAKLVIQLYLDGKFINCLQDVTHQINFPYHVWDAGYFPKCWKRYLRILNRIYNFGFKL